MGQCVSVQKDPDSGLQDFQVSSPLKEKSQTVEITKFDHISRTTSYSYGSEKEAFFDTQHWLDSDFEDDFYSVNGDFTPSRGSTPVHHSFSSTEISRSPNARKKSLSDLFEESGRYVSKATKEMILDLPNESVFASAISSPCPVEARSSYSDQKTPVGDVVVKKVRSLKSFKCCLPQLLLNQSFSSRKSQGEHEVCREK